MRRRHQGWVHYGFSRVDTPPVEFRGGRQHGVAMEAPIAGGMVTPIAAAYEGNIYFTKRGVQGKSYLGVLGFDLGPIPSHARETMATKMEHV